MRWDQKFALLIIIVTWMRLSAYVMTFREEVFQSNAYSYMFVTQDIQTFFQEATSGRTQTLIQEGEMNSSELSEEDYAKCELSRLRSERVEIFKQAIHNLRPSVDSLSGRDFDKFQKSIQKMMAVAVDGVVEK